MFFGNTRIEKQESPEKRSITSFPSHTSGTRHFLVNGKIIRQAIVLYYVQTVYKAYYTNSLLHNLLSQSSLTFSRYFLHFIMFSLNTLMGKRESPYIRVYKVIEKDKHNFVFSCSCFCLYCVDTQTIPQCYYPMFLKPKICTSCD